MSYDEKYVELRLRYNDRLRNNAYNSTVYSVIYLLIPKDLIRVIWDYNSSNYGPNLFYLEIVKHLPLDFILRSNAMTCNVERFRRILSCEIARQTSLNYNFPLARFGHVQKKKRNLDPWSRYSCRGDCGAEYETDCDCEFPYDVYDGSDYFSDSDNDGREVKVHWFIQTLSVSNISFA